MSRRHRLPIDEAFEAIRAELGISREELDGMTFRAVAIQLAERRAERTDDGFGGQDRKSYSDTQDRKSYEVAAERAGERKAHRRG